MNDLNIYYDNLTYNEIISKVRINGGKLVGSVIKFGILGNITVDNYIPLLKYLLLKESIQADIVQGAYDIVMQAVLDLDSSISKFQPDILIVFLNIELVSPNLFQRFLELTPNEINNEKEYLLAYVHRFFEANQANIHSKVIFHLFELPTSPAFDIYEIQNGNGQRALINQINIEIIELSKSFKDIYFIDLNIIRERLGCENYLDKRYWYIGRAPFTIEAAKGLTIEQFKIVNSLYGKTKKCLVVDCDNTLWGGVIGEDGLANIRIGKSYPGNMYLDFQRQILNLYNKGIILAINSKNNESDVLEVLDNHPEMLLKRKHFACIYANWNNKAENIQNISMDLNIGIDSIVFVDDSEFECNFVKETLPRVTVIHLPLEVFNYAETISNCGCFDKIQYTDEDKIRGDLYRVEVERKKFQNSFSDLDAFYKSLEMKIVIKSVDEFSLSRVSQLTQRTNQFNLTTTRYSDDEIRSFMHSDNYDVLLLKLKDKFGDMGIVGVQILDYTIPNEARIDTFLLSCRVIGRGVERVFLRKGIERCIERDCKNIFSSYIPTKKNLLVADFYVSNGFSEISSDENCRYFIISRIEQLVSFDNYFNEIILD